MSQKSSSENGATLEKQKLCMKNVSQVNLDVIVSCD